MAYGDFKDLPRRTTSDKKYYVHLQWRVIQNMMLIKVDLRQCFKYCLIKILLLRVLIHWWKYYVYWYSYWKWKKFELHKPITRKLKKSKVTSSFMDSMWGADHSNMQYISYISRCNKGIQIFIIWATDLGDMQFMGRCKKGIWPFIDVFSKYARVLPLKDEKGKTITKRFQKTAKESNCKANKIWVDKSREFYNKPMKTMISK